MIRTGTCSWTEKTLLKSGEFYPPDIKSARERLEFYSDHFNTVEVDSSYYAIPSEQNALLWAERTPDNFIFHFKAYGALTGHGVNPRSIPKDILSLLPDNEQNKRFTYIKQPEIIKAIGERFVNVLEPLRSSNKLGVVVFQYPQWFHFNPLNFEYILLCKKLMDGIPLAIEFRHGSWLTNNRAKEVFGFLRKNDLSYVTADEPQYGSLATIPYLPEVTSEIAYFRFHGRNTQNWLKKGVETSLRYSYLYSDIELEEFAGSVRRLNRKAKKTYAMFNNCHGGFAVRNALRFKELLAAPLE